MNSSRLLNQNRQKMNETVVTSIGAICYAKWNIALKLPAEYATSPFDNIENHGLHQFKNILSLLQEDFSQIDWRDMKYIEHESRRIDGEFAIFKGYDYIGDKLEKPFKLPHFFDNIEPENAWKRWRHKCESFKKLLADHSKNIIMVSARLNTGEDADDIEKRKVLSNEASSLMEWICDAYGRSPDNCRLISIISVDDVEDTIIEQDSKFIRQVAVPAKEEAGIPYWNRRPRKEYVEMAVEILDYFH